MVQLIEWAHDFPYHPAFLIIALLAELAFWLGFTSLVYHWWKGESIPDRKNPVFSYNSSSSQTYDYGSTEAEE